MSAFDLNQASTPFEENDDHDDREIRDHHRRHHLPVHNPNSDNSFSCTPDLFAAAALHHQTADYCMSYQFHQLQQEPKELIFIPGSSDRAVPRPTDDIKLSLCDAYGASEDGGGHEPVGKYWMSSKMRLMRKMMNSTAQIIVSKSMENMATADGDHGFDANNDNRSGCNSPCSVVVRVCSDCKTTKTPLWRSGPRGPKSLCNACGIRQRKARRAMAAAAAAALNGGVIPAAASAAPGKVRKEKKLDIDRTLPFKKRCKMNYAATTTAAATTTLNNSTTAVAAAKKLCFEDRSMLNSNKNSAAAPAIQKAFPEDERNAAVLLMALSCGLIRS